MRWLALSLFASPVVAQDAATLNAHDFIAVAIEGSLNVRAGPTKEAERMTPLPDGTVLRRIECNAHTDEHWCEIETLDGATEGWAAARFLVPYTGADPLALTDAAIPADIVEQIGESGAISGRLEPGELLDVPFAVPVDRVVTVTLDAPDGFGSAIFADDGTPLAQGNSDTNMVVVFPDGGDVFIRVADMVGTGGDWSLDVRLD